MVSIWWSVAEIKLKIFPTYVQRFCSGWGTVSLLFFFHSASALYVCDIATDTVMIGPDYACDGTVNGCVDTVLTG